MTKKTKPLTQREKYILAASIPLAIVVHLLVKFYGFPGPLPSALSSETLLKSGHKTAHLVMDALRSLDSTKIRAMASAAEIVIELLKLAKYRPKVREVDEMEVEEEGWNRK